MSVLVCRSCRPTLAVHAAVCILGTVVNCPFLVLLPGSHPGAAGSGLWHRNFSETVRSRLASPFSILESPQDSPRDPKDDEEKKVQEKSKQVLVGA